MIRTYIICGTPRSGSTLLCQLLAATGRAGAPHSFFRREDIADWAAGWGLSPPGQTPGCDFWAAYIEAARAEGRGNTPIFGLRLMAETQPEVSEILGRLYPDLSSDRARIARAFGSPLYIHLQREDSVAQAISLVKAQQTGLWHRAPDGTEIERLAPPQEPVYDFARLRAAHLEFDAQKARWPTWFAQQGITPLRISYDQLAADPAGGVTTIFRALQLDPPDPGGLAIPVAKLADDLSAAWARRYASDLAAQGDT